MSLSKKKERKELNKIKQLFLEKKSFFLATHLNPDGDALGSLVGLAIALENQGKSVVMGLGEREPLPPHYLFLPRLNEIVYPDSGNFSPEVFVALDCASLTRLGGWAEVAKKSRFLINLDHHLSNERFGSLNLVETKASSTSELIYRLLKDLNFKLNKEAALAFYVGVLTDTGRFQYANTSLKTFEVAKELVSYGLDTFQIFQEVYENYSFGCLKLLGLVLKRARLDDGLIFSYLTRTDLSDYSVLLPETENYIDFLRLTRDSRLAILFKELPDGKWKVSLRSKKGVYSHLIASRFGGGGHAGAAGFTTSLPRKKVLSLIKEELVRDGWVFSS